MSALITNIAPTCWECNEELTLRVVEETGPWAKTTWHTKDRMAVADVCGSRCLNYRLHCASSCGHSWPLVAVTERRVSSLVTAAKALSAAVRTLSPYSTYGGDHPGDGGAERLYTGLLGSATRVVIVRQCVDPWCSCTLDLGPCTCVDINGVPLRDTPTALSL